MLVVCLKYSRLSQGTGQMSGALQSGLFSVIGCMKKAQALRNGDEFRKGLNLDLFHHSMAMSFNGPYRRPQLGCDLLIDLASNDKVENLSFPRGQQSHQAAETLLQENADEDVTWS